MHRQDDRQKSTVALCLPRAPHLRRFSHRLRQERISGIRRHES